MDSTESGTGVNWKTTTSPCWKSALTGAMSVFRLVRSVATQVNWSAVTSALPVGGSILASSSAMYSVVSIGSQVAPSSSVASGMASAQPARKT